MLGNFHFLLLALSCHIRGGHVEMEGGGPACKLRPSAAKGSLHTAGTMGSRRTALLSPAWTLDLQTEHR
jgi:hypothetical protein